MTNFDVDHAIAILARAQHGAFSHRQAIELGATRRVIERRLANRQWVKLDHHVYALPSHPPTWLRQAKAAELRFEGAALSGRSAAVLHGLAELRPGSIEITVGRGRARGECRLASVRRRDGIPTTVVANIRVVTVEQALADLASTGHPLVLERALDDALLRAHVTAESLAAMHAEMVSRRAKGAGLIGSLIDERVVGYVPPTNELEAALYRVLDDPDLPPYERQAAFPWRPGGPQRVDAYVPTWRRIVEADGRQWHARYEAFERDKRRDHEAQVRGIEVTRFTYRQLVHEPDYARAVLHGIAIQRAA